jgi:hypothetical protein
LQGLPLLFDVQSGTVVDALNRLMQVTDTVLWIATYRPDAQVGQRSPRWDLQMQLMHATNLYGYSGSHRPEE